MIILSTNKPVVEFYTESLQTQSNGNYFIPERNIAIPPHLCEMIEVDSFPDDIEPTKYCYTEEKGFYVNPDWKEPEKYYTLDEAANILVQEVNA
jgi:hypothetical protein|nr:MAG TPA: hypothetical protein [Caudoviricetes sp.]